MTCGDASVCLGFSWTQANCTPLRVLDSTCTCFLHAHISNVFSVSKNLITWEDWSEFVSVVWWIKSLFVFLPHCFVTLCTFPVWQNRVRMHNSKLKGFVYKQWVRLNEKWKKQNDIVSSLNSACILFWVSVYPH